MATKNTDNTIYVQEVKTDTLVVALLGTSPLILNRMSEKVKGELLLPKGRKTAADKAANLKHRPLEEYRASAYTLPEGSDTLLAVMSSAVKGAMMTAALDLPGAKKAQIGRLVYVQNDYVPVYGIPRLFMSVTRSANINRTPDVRTRAIVPEWVALATINFVTPLLNHTSIMNLLAAGGLTAGIGDWRPEKGKGSFGQFTVVSIDDPVAQSIVSVGGYGAQLEALEHPLCYDQDTARLLNWYTEQVQLRGQK